MKRKILVAPLNWGLGHAARSIPIINALVANNYEPIIASDGPALELLKKEFPNLTSLELPSYQINYSKNGRFLKWKLLKDTPKILSAIQAEIKATKIIVETHKIVGIISDNRFGVRSSNIPSVFMTHQLQVLSGSTTWLSTKIHQHIIRKFDICWVPDCVGPQNLGGKLSHKPFKNINVSYIGPLSRFRKLVCNPIYDVMILLSGPEPQRTMLEEKLLFELELYDGTVLFVKGLMEKEQRTEKFGSITIHNFLIGNELERALNASKLIVCRSGYTTIMDLAKLEKNAYFIPTPGQFEQEYLAKILSEQRLVASCTQTDFKLENLKNTSDYKGLKSLKTSINFQELFKLFEGK